MTIATCPKCHDEVTIPQAGTELSRVACPLCREEFLLSEVLRDLPPALILLDPPEEDEEPETTSSLFTDVHEEAAEATGETEAVEQDEATDTTAEEAADKEEENDQSVTTEGLGAFDFAKSSESADSRTLYSSRPKGHKSESPVLFIIKVIGGGLVAIPLAQLLLWWITALWLKDRHVDFGVGPWLAKYQYTRWIVPEKYWEPAPDEESEQSENSESSRGPERLVRIERSLSPNYGGTTRTAGLSRVTDLRWRARQQRG